MIVWGQLHTNIPPPRGGDVHLLRARRAPPVRHPQETLPLLERESDCREGCVWVEDYFYVRVSHSTSLFLINAFSPPHSLPFPFSSLSFSLPTFPARFPFFFPIELTSEILKPKLTGRCRFVGILFVDALQRMWRVTAEADVARNSGQPVQDVRSETNFAARKF